MTPQSKTDYPNAWIPQHDGDSITGELVEIVRAWSDARARNGDGFYPLLKLKLPDGNLKDFHAFQIVSFNQVREKQPLPGETVTITYRGEGKAKEGQNAPKLFQIDVHGRDPQEAAADTYADLFGNDAVKSAKRAAREVEQGNPVPDDVPWTDADLGPEAA